MGSHFVFIKQKSAMRIIYAFSNSKPSADGHIQYHGVQNRGTTTLYLLDDIDGECEAAKLQAINDTTSVIEYRVNNVSFVCSDAKTISLSFHECTDCFISKFHSSKFLPKMPHIGVSSSSFHKKFKVTTPR